ncbi:MAG: hypothetical protein ACE3JK_14595 [Sporolactobacillus sp.]
MLLIIDKKDNKFKSDKFVDAYDFATELKEYRVLHPDRRFIEYDQGKYILISEIERFEDK